jgi:hypothetical protein
MFPFKEPLSGLLAASSRLKIFVQFSNHIPSPIFLIMNALWLLGAIVGFTSMRINIPN